MNNDIYSDQDRERKQRREHLYDQVMYLKKKKKILIEKNQNVYDTDAILSTEFPVFHEDFSGRSG